MNDEAGRLTIRLLGPLSACLGRNPMTPTAGKPRQALALLALHAGRVVTVPTLVEELWGDHPPRSYATTLQTYILQLRNALTAAAKPGNQDARQLLATKYGGYLLDGESCTTDAAEFDRLACSGRAAAEAGDQQAASERLATALRLWSGPALVDVPLGRTLELEAAALEETRLGVLERRIEADLSLGRHADLLGELTMTAARNPMNENLCGLLMVALYRSGHVSRSLEAFRQIRAVLHQELGIEPCPRLQRLQLAILSGDPALEPGPVPRFDAARVPSRSSSSGM
jgi:DNA-binding SARP family transcriptional activator